jgi:hypothetical protein
MVAAAAWYVQAVAWCDPAAGGSSASGGMTAAALQAPRITANAVVSHFLAGSTRDDVVVAAMNRRRDEPAAPATARTRVQYVYGCLHTVQYVYDDYCTICLWVFTYMYASGMRMRAWMIEQILGLSIVQQPTARPPRGTPIGMARRMPDGPAHGLPPACGTPASHCPRACLARREPLLLCATRPGRHSRG